MFRIISVRDHQCLGLELRFQVHHVCLHRRRQGLDVTLPGKWNSNSHGARPVHLIIKMIKWIRTSRLSINNSLSAQSARAAILVPARVPALPGWVGVRPEASQALEPLLWLPCYTSGRCLLEYIIGTQCWGSWFRGSSVGFHVSCFGFQISGFRVRA